MNLEDIIRYDPESVYVDFKREEYRKEKYYALIKDIVSMANANFKGSRYIIIGVDLSNGERTYPGIKGPLVDSAIYQNLVHEKVEPEIDLKYYSYQFEGVQLGIMEISGCDNQPYMLKNELQPLKKGDSFIRKGSTQLPFMRSDLDKIWANRMHDQSFKGDVEVLFKENKTDKLIVKAVRDFMLPSEKAATQIRDEVANIDRKTFNNIEDILIGNIREYLRETGKYSNMSKDELKSKLATVKQDYAEHDLYDLHEVKSTKINFTVKSLGEQYIEDSTIKIYIDKQPGLHVALDEYTNPKNKMFEFKSRFDPDYPKVWIEGNQYCVEVNLPSIKHLVPLQLFEVDLRITFLQELKGKSVPLSFEIAGKNLKTPIKKVLNILVE
ncbi:ATP-binding protein [Chitinophaga polysaccharea]|uniref:AlbA family DNA-binding domain-containing protein n=1 Tax=Chitinophaga polysaccharea TaxID=1293035 RepID=UPI001455AB4F|nr:ATP-binding protein [Chitinophaga polysaccharea]NLR60727.1 ATP-binding protein [Chitinophaga polysaccharea]